MGLGELIGFRDVSAVEVYPRVNFVPQQFVRTRPAAGPAGRSTPKPPSTNDMKSPGGQRGKNQDAPCRTIMIWTRVPNVSAHRTGGHRAQRDYWNARSSGCAAASNTPTFADHGMRRPATRIGR